ncbi:MULTISPECIES: flagellar assembly peptidoglycan hydrolase FlgJ [unclassified Pseudoalteromonas]|uniref:flagellar assembly peptidoglycan hydrolase FlgJ n=1 Tax=unclassified Pseudoalteromonas TaxID=194690 RepID=UPI000730F68A|nr:MULTISPECIES: flagellar assembly peptidoglycan hydrolase FlgJ [unclassified Pseudoalteromonas]KTD98910.1 glucosaminidase [Pseudoalteromonas sp. H71]MBW4965118.1 flagellar assembly peptidoglycan hydrolase FlgJ [Pseudoalteromonas sp. CR1]TMN85854.1 flagellar assembly peptidoglycan hydrolase FlgJ [Pseudoalteromonas sp. S410]TMN93183.1 flagellar assembly peptidoglycan hydrolase FlgJ [Pseudoalteromonas sp. S408]TMN99673.1 flagellar assembly peptidoglycan hydrolase FlgJ [Pseudoalteromonas sp. S40|tara:strand:- start:1197 stop:2192 length:996 start_codon:yes stop_codon:yes gene_type:complete
METNHLDKQNFFDLGNLDSLRKEALSSGDASTDASKAALKKAAAQFEAIFTQMLLKSMRKANEAFEDKESPLNSSSVKFFEDMHDQQLSTELSSNGSLGLADLIVQQLSPDGKTFMPGSVLRTTNDFLSDMRAGSSLPHTQNEENAAINVHNNKADSKVPKASSAPFESTEEFVTTVWEHAKTAAQKIGLNPAVMVAQAALETGWGKHIINKSDGNSSNNLFNIKSDKSWDGEKASKVTLEFEEGTPVKKQASFRAYDSIKESVNDFVDFLTQNPRYQEALQNTAKPSDFLDSLQRAGYATDPNYADKIKKVLNSAQLKDVATSVIRQGVK